jgi:hypothetical protein
VGGSPPRHPCTSPQKAGIVPAKKGPRSALRFGPIASLYAAFAALCRSGGLRFAAYAASHCGAAAWKAAAKSRVGFKEMGEGAANFVPKGKPFLAFSGVFLLLRGAVPRTILVSPLAPRCRMFCVLALSPVGLVCVVAGPRGTGFQFGSRFRRGKFSVRWVGLTGQVPALFRQPVAAALAAQLRASGVRSAFVARW